MTWTPNRRMATVASVIFFLDQFTKFLVLYFLATDQETVIVDGFFKFVRWGNTGAAWSLLHDNNLLLAVISILALTGLVLWRDYFDTKTLWGQIALGLIFGGIVGNLLDRLHPMRHQVIDFLRFYMYQRNGQEIGFPAFNVADSAICIGVTILILISWIQDRAADA